MSNPYHIEEGAPEIEERVERPVLLPLLDFPQQPARLEHENAVEEPYERSKATFMELPELLNLDFDKIKKKIIYGTDLERAEKEDDFKVAIFCCNVPSHFVITAIGVLSFIFLILTAIVHMDKRIVLYETVPWLSSFALTVSVLLAMWLKLPKLLKPFRIFCAASRCLLLAVVVITFLFTIVSSVGVIIGGLVGRGRLSHDAGTMFLHAVLIILIYGTLYFVYGTVASAATRCYFYLEKQHRR